MFLIKIAKPPRVFLILIFLIKKINKITIYQLKSLLMLISLYFFVAGTNWKYSRMHISLDEVFPRFWRIHLSYESLADFHWEKNNSFFENPITKKCHFLALKILNIFFAKLMRYVYFCTMDGFFRILTKALSKLICTQLYFLRFIHL